MTTPAGGFSGAAPYSSALLGLYGMALARAAVAATLRVGASAGTPGGGRVEGPLTVERALEFVGDRTAVVAAWGVRARGPAFTVLGIGRVALAEGLFFGAPGRRVAVDDFLRAILLLLHAGLLHARGGYRALGVFNFFGRGQLRLETEGGEPQLPTPAFRVIQMLVLLIFHFVVSSLQSSGSLSGGAFRGCAD